MRSNRVSSAWAAALFVAGAGLVAYASVPKVEVTIQAHKEVVRVDASGKKSIQLKPAEQAATGDTVVYTLRASNTGTGPALNARIEDPIPTGTVLVLDSVINDGTRIEASLDNGKTWQSFPATVARKNDRGAEEKVLAPAELYTTLRWVLNGALQPGDGKDVSFKVRVR